ncbi:hypothetical protein HO133_008062 [Letharia lupina]|uniref:Ribosome quality control complex subunit 2 n=1 Tax=Letharia lupina TaxID=560253 RepID=A0A8H6CRQ0_9LECA|nr:uncharacterized protein HO133_008062 [Letharia lupina]KAF6228332.1 hypothetical protein HO133_008062 [Letharia lupina]
MKQRFSSLDVKVIAQELSHALCTLRLANVYDLSSRIFLLKFAKPDQRKSLVIDSGFRCHLTSFTRATAAAPSAFVARLRKFLRTRRVTAVSQVGTDRIIEIQFSDGQHRLFLEFYAGGNIVLTDKDLGIISLLRVVAEEQEQLRVGLKYSLTDRQNYNGIPALTSERISAGLQKAVDKVGGEITAHQKKSKKKPGDALRKALASSMGEFPPMLIDHALRVAAFDPNTPVEDVLKDSSLRERLVVTLREAQRIVDTSSVTCKGYIIAKPAKTASATVQDPVLNDGTATRHSLMYEEFHPFRPQQFEDNSEITMLELDGYNKTVDEFFSSIESQKLESRLTEREENAKRKLETARLDHQKRLGGLQQVQELNIRKAQAIEANLRKVQEALVAVNALISQGMDWQEMARLIEMEQERHNVVAEMIKLPLKLYENTATLLLSEANYEDEDDYDGDETGSDVSVSDSDEDLQTKTKVHNVPKPADKRLAVDIDLALSPWSNARQYYEQKRSAAVKEQKTLQSSEKALKSTEKKISADLKKGLKQEKEVMRPQRKAIWFEKFVYFISSEGYLVLGGKDAQQNEILYKRYLKKGDVYIHADLHGAASVIVKNKLGMSESPVPPSTLSQAGTLAVATSSAWDSKAVMSAWWVDANQVSKTAPTGEFLPTGSFVIRGHKNFLPPAQLLLGFGIMFRVSEESKVRHLRHRVQDPVGPTPSELGKDVEDIGGDQDDADGMESQAEDQQIEADDDENQELGHIQDADGAESNGGDDSEVDGNSDHVRDNPLQPTGRQQSALHPPDHPSDVLAKDSGTEPDEATSGESSNEEDESEQREQTPNCENSFADTYQRRHLYAKERRLLRKGPLPSTMDPAETAPTSTDSEGNANPAQISNPSTQPDTKYLPPRVRGKHGKRQKLKTKYASQDEEDRALAMRLLGSATAQEKATEDAAAKADKEKKLATQKERRREQHAMAAEKGKKAEELRKLNFEEGIETLDDHELEGSDGLDAFVGNPLPGDELLDALVVCGPWDAIGGRYKWRVKLQPGTTKKGKAVREILGKWNGMVTEREKKKRPGSGEGDEAILEEETLRMREAQLIKAIREPEIVGVVPVGKVRVVMGPGEAGGKGKGGGGAGKGKRGGKGSKKQR